MYAHFAATSVLGLLVALGYRYRVTAPLLCLCLTTSFLMERGVYINHTYLYCLFALLLCAVPANRDGSLDARAGRVARAATAPAWTLYLLRFQIAVVYVYAGIAKLEPDWLAGRPTALWLAQRGGYPVIGALLTSPGAAHAFSWLGLAFDLLIVPALLCSRTRRAAFACAIVFHSINVVLFGIGTFPWFSLVATALFFAPTSFRRLPVFHAILASTTAIARGQRTRPPAATSAAAFAALTLYVAIQLTLPLRHFLYPGRHVWTEEGRTFAWQMMLRDKRGSASFEVTDPATHERWTENPGDYVTPWQLRTMVGNPDLVLQFAHYLAERYEARTGRPVEVRARTHVSLNGRPAQALVDPDVDLAHEPRRLGHYSWIVPLAEAGAPMP